MYAAFFFSDVRIVQYRKQVSTSMQTKVNQEVKTYPDGNRLFRSESSCHAATIEKHLKPTSLSDN